MRLGANLDIGSDDPEQKVNAYANAGYSAAVCPDVKLDQTERIRAIRRAFNESDIMLAELGVWNNMLHPDPAQRTANIEANVDALAVADEIGVRCTINIAGSFDPDIWDGPHLDNLSEEAFELTIQHVRYIIDSVKPKRTYYCLETMPWMIPDSIESYLRLVNAIDRPMFAVHLDPVNMINCPTRFYSNATFLRECFDKLGTWIISCHAKDIKMGAKLTVHLDEVRPGLGSLDYKVFLLELNRLPGDVPLILEHLPAEEYPLAREYVSKVAREVGINFHIPHIG